MMGARLNSTRCSTHNTEHRPTNNNSEIMDRRLPTMIALSLLSCELDSRPSADGAVDRRRRRGARGADDVLRLAAAAMSVGYSISAMANMQPSKTSKIEDMDEIPEMDGSCSSSITDSFRSPRTEGLHEDEKTKADEDECEDACSVSSDDVSFYVSPEEGFISSASVCESDISVSDDEYSFFNDASDDEHDYFDLSDDQEDVPIYYSRDKSAILENPHLALRDGNDIQGKNANLENPHLLLRKPLKDHDECDAVPAMKSIDSFGSMASEYTVDDTVNGFEVTPTKNRGIGTQSRTNAVWSLF